MQGLAEEDPKSPAAEDQVREHVRNLNVHKGPAEIHPQGLRELADEVLSH